MPRMTSKMKTAAAAKVAKPARRAAKTGEQAKAREPKAKAGRKAKAPEPKPKAARKKTTAAKAIAKAIEERAQTARAKKQQKAQAARGGGRGRAAARAPKLLAGGNPQITKAEGDAPVQQWIAALPGWKRGLAHTLDALIARTVPGVRKAVKWNSPFYGVEGQGWFLTMHAFTNYLKLAFFRGASLRPVPPGASKHAEVRYLDVRETGPLDGAQLAEWIRQAAALPGWVP